MNWNQLQTILWLRWRLMCNQWRRTGGLGALFTFVVGAMALGMAGASFVGGLLGGLLGGQSGLAKQSPQVIMFVLLGITVVFLFLWMIGLLTELQRSETIDLQKLMHLPVALGQMFAINYIASLFTMSLVVAVPAMIGLGLGLAVMRAPLMILLVPLALSMVFMISAWTYCLRGWLASMMTNPRRRRTVIMCITLAFVLLAQGPNIYFNVIQRFNSSNTAQTGSRRADRNIETKAFFEKLNALQGFFPPCWVPVGAKALAEGNPLAALLGTLGSIGIGVLGLRRAYRNTVRFYQGETGGKVPAKRMIASRTAKNSGPGRPRARGFLEYSIPFAPEQSSALALATLRSLLRAPEVKMAWASSFIVTLVFGAMFLFRTTGTVPDPAKPFIATGAVVFPIFFLAQFFGNQFGFDRDGFRALMLSPADRRLILLGKNLAILPVGFFTGTLLIALTSYRLHLSPLTMVATAFQLASVLLMASVAGNVISVMAPYRIQPGSMKPTKMPGVAMIVLMLFQMLLPMAMLPVFAGPLLDLLWQRMNWPDFIPVNLLASTLLLGLITFIYWQTLRPLGRLLHRREPKILAIIAVEVE